MSSKHTDIFGIEPLKLGGNGPSSSGPSNVQLALLSDPFFNYTVWYPAQYISVDSSNKSYSTGFWNNLASYTPSAASEVLSRFTVKFSEAPPVAVNISIWVKPLGSFEYDTGIVIPINPVAEFGQNLTDTITLNAGDEIKFTTDNVITVQWVVICATRQ